jgi:hypothetical protein
MIDINKIVDWIFSYLKNNGKTYDEILFWESANHFLDRKDIYDGSKILEFFAADFDESIVQLKNNLIISEKDGMMWVIYHDEIDYHNLVLRSKRPSSTKEYYPCFYMVTFNNGFKIGQSVNAHSRLAEYKRPWCRPVLNIEVFESDDHVEIERMVIEQFFNMHYEYCDSRLYEKIKREIESRYAPNMFQKYVYKRRGGKIDTRYKLFRTGELEPEYLR